MYDFTKGPIGRQILLFSIPIILGNFFMQFYQIINTVIVGQYLGKEALAAVGASNPVIFALVSLIIGISSGASIIVSQYLGAKDTEKVRITSDTLHIFLIGAGVLIALAGFAFSKAIFRMIDLPEDILPAAEQYLHIILCGVVFMFAFNSINAILRAMGDSKTPLYFLVLSAILNLLLDLLFILQFDWGVPGVAWASVISSLMAYIWLVIYVNKRFTLLKIDFLNLKFDFKIFRQTFKYGLPTGVQQAFVAIGSVALMAIVNSYGTDVIAGYSAGLRVDSLAVIPAMNFAMGLQAFVGQNVGAGNWDRVRKGFYSTLFYSTLTCILLTAVIVLFGRDIMSLFTNDVAVIEVGNEYLVIISLFFVVFSTMFTFTGVMRGAGAVMIPMIATMISMWGVRIPVAAWLSSHYGDTGIWWSIPIGWAFGCVFVAIYYFSGRWKNHSIFAKKQ